MSHDKLPEIGKKYKIRYLFNSNDWIDTVKVTDITTLGDGTVIVQYSKGWLMPTIKNVELSEFIKNAEELK